ncbi:MAG: HD-GYP domain-containing protein [Thermodesulfobacteriota bacterium]
MVEFKDIIKEKIESKGVKPEKKRTKKSPPFQPESDHDSMAIFTTDKSDPDKVFREALQYVEEIGFKIKEGVNFQIGPLFNISEAIVDNLRPHEMLTTRLQNNQKTDKLLLNASSIGQPLDYLVLHMVNVAIFAIEIGIGLLYSREQLFKLGVAGLLHDVGMWKIPDEIVKKHGALNNEEFDMIKRHTEYGFEILSSLGEEYAWLAEIALQEHERENGKGYPRGLKGEEINENAKIIGLADVYEAISHSRSYKKYLLPHHAIKEILNTLHGFFPTNIIKALVERLSIFPLYSYVKLNSGYIGRVIEVDEARPLRPTVEVLFDSQKKKLDKTQRVKLSDTPILYITGAVDEGDLPDLNAVAG